MPTPNIWQLQTKGDTDALVEALRHPDATVRKGAAAALRALGAWQAVPALDAALALENDWQAHAAISAALQYLDRDIHVETMVKNKDVRGLSKMLTSSKLEDIITACGALGKMGDRRAVESLVTVFRNPLLPSNVRLAAAEALLALESAPAVVTLLGALRRDNWQVRRNAAAVLGQLQAVWATQPLIELLQDSNQAVRRTAAAALRRINTPEALKAANEFDESQAKSATQEVKFGEDAPLRGTGPLAKPVTGTLSTPAVSRDAEPTTSKATAPLPTLPDSPKLPVVTPSPAPPDTKSAPSTEPMPTTSKATAPLPTLPELTKTPLVLPSTAPSTTLPTASPDAAPTIPKAPVPLPTLPVSVSPAPATPLPQSAPGPLAGTKPLAPSNESTPDTAAPVAPTVLTNLQPPASTPPINPGSLDSGDSGPVSRLDKLRTTQQMQNVMPPPVPKGDTKPLSPPPGIDLSRQESVVPTATEMNSNGSDPVKPIEPIITPPVDTASMPKEPDNKPDSGSA